MEGKEAEAQVPRVGEEEAGEVPGLSGKGA